MWSPKPLARIAVVVALLAVSACGFKPVYDTRASSGGSTAMESLHHLAIAPIPNRAGVRLKNELERLFSPAAQPMTHTVYIDLHSKSTVTAIEDDASVRRRNLELVAEVRLVRAGGAVSIPDYKTTVRSNAGAEQLPSDFSTLVSEGAAEQRAVEHLARQIRQRLALHFAQPG